MGMKVIECEIYSRVVGYYRPIQQWNEGKHEEYLHREEFHESICVNSALINGVEVYTSQGCPRCESVKEELASKGIPYREISVSTAFGAASLRELYKKQAEDKGIEFVEGQDISLPVISKASLDQCKLTNMEEILSGIEERFIQWVESGNGSKGNGRADDKSHERDWCDDGQCSVSV